LADGGEVASGQAQQVGRRQFHFQATAAGADMQRGQRFGAAGLAELAWRQRRPRTQLLLPLPPEPLQVGGQGIDAPRLIVRGPWLLLLWRAGGRRQRLLFWPDVLDSGQRRELRLAVAARSVSRRAR
ncbi:hypothetical protein, partial [Mesorhizobium sp. M8A.F.Ca.ET.142.01.1.1]|uniref:hypothetical protein n=1 Tax=Mesorhizobium sp. M8A.F.Ca.ET.142.01.1.1 TaxID=2563958 RepID=UPI001AEE89B2